MRLAVKEVYTHELALAREARRSLDYESAVTHLERAHILGQRYLFAHLHTHTLLLAVAAERADVREMIGQIIRLIAVVPGYVTGWVPKGNTGSANVSARQPMTPPDDLAPLIASHCIARDVVLRILLLVLAALIYHVFATPVGAEVLRAE